MFLKSHTHHRIENMIVTKGKYLESPFGGFIQILETENSFLYLSMMDIVEFPKESLMQLNDAVEIKLPAYRVTNTYIKENKLTAKFIVCKNSVLVFYRGKRVSIGRKLLARLQEVLYVNSRQIDVSSYVSKKERHIKRNSNIVNKSMVTDLGDSTMVDGYTFNNKLFEEITKLPILVRDIEATGPLEKSFIEQSNGLTFKADDKLFVLSLSGVQQLLGNRFKVTKLTKALDTFIEYRKTENAREAVLSVTV